MGRWNRLYSRILGLSVLLLLFGSSACKEWTGSQDSFEPISKLKQPIIGGKTDSRHPAVGALTSSGRSFCTGTLIATRVVLTAGHCIDAAKRGGQLQFRIELVNPQKPNGIEFKFYDIDANLLSSHPGWKQNVSSGFDVGFAILKKSVPDTVAKVIRHNSKPLVLADWKGKDLLFLGYGLIQSVPSAVPAERKYGVNIPVVTITKDRIQHQAPGKSVCHGDSGGPALAEVDGVLRVIGVNSYVNGAAVPGTNRSRCDASGFSMRTDVYLKYIHGILSQYGDGPLPCKSDNECSACSTCGGKNVCIPKTLAPDPKMCKPCSKDSDCGQGICHHFATGFRCLQPCTSSNCCPAGSACTPVRGSTGAQYCMPKTSACPDIQCKTKAECGPGEACNAGTCRPVIPSRSPKLCHACSSVQDCDSPQHLCYGPQGNMQCLQPCSEGDFCPDGFSCKSLYPSAPKQCVPNNKACEILCKLDAHCPKGRTCQKGICAKPSGAEEGELCQSTFCKAGLNCVETQGGKRCLKACGVASGSAGSFCKDGRTCSDGSRCYAFSQTFRVCLNPCSSDEQCGDSGGGRCYQGVCLCQSSSDCDGGYTCNTTTQSVGACVKQSVSKPCAGNAECRPLARGSYCVPKGAGSRSVGESCDSLNRCSKGLLCLPTRSGAVCVEDCTQSQRCKLGGSCFDYGRGSSVRICLCRGSRSCPSGRVCEARFQGNYGLCRLDPKQSTPKCVDDIECPAEYVCTDGTCTYKKIEPKEPQPDEPTPEPSLDAGTTPERIHEPKQPEKQNQEKTIQDTLKAPDVTKPVDQGAQPPSNTGCGCSVHNTEENRWPNPLSMVLFLGLLWGIRRRTR